MPASTPTAVIELARTLYLAVPTRSLADVASELDSLSRLRGDESLKISLATLKRVSSREGWARQRDEQRQVIEGGVREQLDLIRSSAEMGGLRTGQAVASTVALEAAKQYERTEELLRRQQARGENLAAHADRHLRAVIESKVGVGVDTALPIAQLGNHQVTAASKILTDLETAEKKLAREDEAQRRLSPARDSEFASRRFQARLELLTRLQARRGQAIRAAA